MRCFVYGLVLTLSVFCASEELKPKIDWLYFDFPPYHFFEGDFENQGIVDPLVYWVQRANPDYQHSFVSVSLPRAVTFMEQPEENHCLLASFMDNAFSETWARSKVIFREIPPLVAMKREAFERIGSPESVSLKNLLTDYPSLTFGRARNQLISEELNEFLDSYQRGNIETVSSSQSTLNLHKMLAFDRVDYIVTYGAEIGWIQASTYQEEYDSIVMIPIEEASTTFNSVYVSCPRIGQGEDIINAINATINDSVLAAIWLQYLNWLPDIRSQVFFLSNQSK